MLMKPLPMLFACNPFSKPLVLISSSLLSLYTENYTWVGCHRGPFLLYWFQNFPARSMKGRLKKTLIIFTTFFMCPYT